MSNDKQMMGGFDIAEIINQAGGFEKFKTTLREFEALNLRMDNDRAALAEKYPYKWVAMGKNEFFEVGDSLQSVCEAARNQGLGASEYSLRFLDPDPPVLII